VIPQFFVRRYSNKPSWDLSVKTSLTGYQFVVKISIFEKVRKYFNKTGEMITVWFCVKEMLAVLSLFIRNW
jgi:hypothetical protein